MCLYDTSPDNWDHLLDIGFLAIVVAMAMLLEKRQKRP